MNMRFVFFFLCVFLNLTSGYSQYYSSGEDPSSINWHQINTSYFRLVYPVSQEVNAQHIANVLDNIQDKSDPTLLSSRKKITIIIHGNSSTSNGLVAWAPMRLELYPVGPQQGSIVPWLDKLSIHEFRHVVQMNKLEQGLTSFLNYIFGQQITSAVAGLYIPPWFSEGDAVCCETSFTNGGRGRSSFFSQELRAQLLEKGKYSYDKAFLGSYKDFVPNHYKLGYYLVAKAKQNYGSQIWNNVIDRVGRKSIFGFSSFSKGLSDFMHNKREMLYDSLAVKYKSSNIDFSKVKEINNRRDKKLSLYLDSFDQLKWEWQKQDSAIIKSPFEKLSDRKDIYTNYRFPVYINKKEILFRKSGMSTSSRFCMLNTDNNTERDVFINGYDFNNAFSYFNNTLIWAENKDHLRWQHANKAKIAILNINKNKYRYLNYSHSLFAPKFSPLGDRILAVEINNNGEQYIDIFDTENDELLSQIAADNNDAFISPVWKNKDTIISIILNTNGKSIVDIDLKTKKYTNIIPACFSDISNLFYVDNKVLFNANYSGIDNIYALDLSSKIIYQITSSRFGARDASCLGNKIIYSDYTSDGYIIAQIDYQPDDWTIFNGNKYKFPLAESLYQQDNYKLNIDKPKAFKTKNYSKIKNLVNVHSWAPIYINPETRRSAIGISMFSQNSLNTMSISSAVEFDPKYKYGKYSVAMEYKGFYPVLKSEISYYKHSLYLSKESLKLNIETSEIDNNISFPFNFSKGQKSRFFIPKLNFKSMFSNVDAVYQNDRLVLDQKRIETNILELSFFYMDADKKSKRDIFPRWYKSCNITLGRNTSPMSEASYLKSVFNIILPAFDDNSVFNINLSYFLQNAEKGYFMSNAPQIRGISNIYSQEQATVSLSYNNVWLYPDFSIGRLAYINRIKLKPFLDIIKFDGLTNMLDVYQSYGCEITADINILRNFNSLDFGFRYGVESLNRKSFFNLILNLNI